MAQAVATHARKTSRARMTARGWKDLRRGLLFISPWILGLLAFTLFPLVYSIAISFTSYSGFSSPKWFGIQNYTRLFTDPIVGVSAMNTMWYAVFAVPIGLIIALLLAVAMNRRAREVSLYRTILYLPSLIPAFAFSFIFVVLLNPGYGIVNKFISAFGYPAQDYLSNPVGIKGVIIGMAQFAAGNAALIVTGQWVS